MKAQVPRLALGRVHSLPSLSYLQKVDAWKANQSSSRSFYDNLALHGFDGVSPKKKAQDVVSEAFNHMLSRDTSQIFGANPSSQMTQPLSSSHSGSGSPRRVDVVGTGACRGQASESPVNRSHSHSSWALWWPLFREILVHTISKFQWHNLITSFQLPDHWTISHPSFHVEGVKEE